MSAAPNPRGNLLAYAMTVRTAAMARPALDLRSQPAYRTEGCIALAVLAATLLWAVLPAFTGHARKEAAEA